MGGAYRAGVPSRSLYNFRVLLAFCDEIGFQLAEDFYWFNPAKLPSPIEWVNKRKLCAKDSVNTVWWFSKTDFPKADIRKVLTPYSDRMKKLIEDPYRFPSELPAFFIKMLSIILALCKYLYLQDYEMILPRTAAFDSRLKTTY